MLYIKKAICALGKDIFNMEDAMTKGYIYYDEEKCHNICSEWSKELKFGMDILYASI